MYKKSGSKIRQILTLHTKNTQHKLNVIYTANGVTDCIRQGMLGDVIFSLTDISYLRGYPSEKYPYSRKLQENSTKLYVCRKLKCSFRRSYNFSDFSF